MPPLRISKHCKFALILLFLLVVAGGAIMAQLSAAPTPWVILCAVALIAGFAVLLKSPTQ